MSDLAYEGATVGKTLHALFRHDSGDIALDLTAGTGLRTNLYSATEAEMIAAEIPAGVYAPTVLVGTAAGHAVTDVLDGVIEAFFWDGQYLHLTKILAGYPVSQINVGPERTALVKQTSGGLVGECAYPLAVGESKLLAIDFRLDLPPHGQIEGIVDVVSLGAYIGQCTLDVTQQGIDGSQIKVRPTATVAGPGRILATVTYSPNSQQAKAMVDLTIVDPTL